MVNQKRRVPLTWASLLSFTVALSLGAGGCEGTGSEQPGRIIQQAGDPRCTPVGGPYPSGLDTLPNNSRYAVLMQFTPKALLAFDLGVSPPRLITQEASPAFPADSDGDGVPDIEAFREAGLCPEFNPLCFADPKPGHVNAIREDLVFVTTSDYEQVLFMEPSTGRLKPLSVLNPENQAQHRAQDWPLLPEQGAAVLRTGVSTQRCIHPDPALDSQGEVIGMDPQCDVDKAGFMTGFTVATAYGGERLFVATSNLASPSEARFNPGSLLIYDLNLQHEPPTIQPHVEKPLLQTSDFNPTALSNYVTPLGRELILVTNTGALSFDGNLIGASGVDVIDVESLKVVARYPLGQAGARGPVAIDPTGRIGLLGAESQRALYAIDLAPLDDPQLYVRLEEPPVDLDGSTPNFPDARIFWADQPLTWPGRPDGPSERLCPTRTDVSFGVNREIAYATDWCDGSLAVLSVDWRPPFPVPFPAEQFRILDRLDWAAPKTPALYGLSAAPSMIQAPDSTSEAETLATQVVFVLNEPEGQLCTANLTY